MDGGVFIRRGEGCHGGNPAGQVHNRSNFGLQCRRGKQRPSFSKSLHSSFQSYKTSPIYVHQLLQLLQNIVSAGVRRGNYWNLNSYTPSSIVDMAVVGVLCHVRRRLSVSAGVCMRLIIHVSSHTRAVPACEKQRPVRKKFNVRFANGNNFREHAKDLAWLRIKGERPRRECT